MLMQVEHLPGFFIRYSLDVGAMELTKAGIEVLDMPSPGVTGAMRKASTVLRELVDMAEKIENAACSDYMEAEIVEPPNLQTLPPGFEHVLIHRRSLPTTPCPLLSIADKVNR